MDLIEIDAASNTSVDDVRDLRDKINFSPSQGKYKIYIIDEVHMLSTAAFNALLKTLEEPGKTSILILVSSDSGKLLDTIKSRCQIMNFSVAPEAALEKFLTRQDKNISPECIKDILELSQGKPGIAMNLLRNAELLKKIKEEKGEILNFFNSFFEFFA